MSYPTLYSFRRCPYAMRARLAIFSAKIEFEHREVFLREKPPAFLKMSAKGTVPVLLTNNGKLIEESVDIMKWALRKKDPEQLLDIYSEKHFDEFVSEIDNKFKNNLDNYKYLNEGDNNKLKCRDSACEFFEDLDSQLSERNWLIGDSPKIYDLTVLPFIRQFANVDRIWFDSQPWLNVHKWLNTFLESNRFKSIMFKYKKWQVDDVPIIMREFNP